MRAGQDTTRRPSTVTPTRRPPDFFIVGHPKCGTSALFQMLRRHPQVHMPVKEPTFFAKDLPARWPREGGLTFDRYLDLFADATPEQRVGEASVWHLLSTTAAAGIAQVNPQAKIIAILREPVSYLHSIHLQLLRSQNESAKDLRSALALEDERRRGRRIPRQTRRPPVLQYSQHIRYTEQISRYHAAFPRDQVMVLIYEQFRQDNVDTVRRILQFIDVDDTTPVEPVIVNAAVAPRSGRFNGAVRNVVIGRGRLSRSLRAGARLTVPEHRRKRLQSAYADVVSGRTPVKPDGRPLALGSMLAKAMYKAPPAPDEALSAELRARFRPEVVKISDYLGIDLVRIWGYENV